MHWLGIREKMGSVRILPDDIPSMNHNGVTLGCTRCERGSVAIIEGIYYCSSHALSVTVERLVGQGLVVDLRTREPLLDLVKQPPAPLDPRSIAFAV